MLTGDDLSTQYFIATLAIAALGLAVTQAGLTQRPLIQTLFGLGTVLALMAVLWKPISETFPRLRDFASPIGSSPSAWFVLLIVSLSTILLLDYRARTSANPPTKDKIRDIQSQLEALGAREEAARGDIIQTMTSLARVSDKGINAANDKIAKLENNTTRNNQKILGYDRDFPVLLTTILEHLALSLLSCIQEPPRFSQIFSKLTPELADVERKSAEEYCTEVNRLLGSTQWGIYLRSILGNSEGLGEHALRSIPNGERPSNIDPLDLRRYMIAKVKCESLWAFIQSEKRETADKYLAHLNFLKQRQYEREHASHAN